MVLARALRALECWKEFFSELLRTSEPYAARPSCAALRVRPTDGRAGAVPQQDNEGLGLGRNIRGLRSFSLVSRLIKVPMNQSGVLVQTGHFHAPCCCLSLERLSAEDIRSSMKSQLQPNGCLITLSVPATHPLSYRNMPHTFITTCTSHSCCWYSHPMPMCASNSLNASGIGLSSGSAAMGSDLEALQLGLPRPGWGRRRRRRRRHF